jgi:hypothetical protein
MCYVGLEVILVSTNSNPKSEEIVEKKVGVIKGKRKYRAPTAVVNSTCKISRVNWETGLENSMLLENVAKSCGSLLSCFISHRKCAL